MECESIKWRRHALERMLERSVSRAMVKQVIKYGKVIENYDSDQPFPSKLLFAVIGDIPLHVVLGKDPLTEGCYVITAYSPTNEYFEDDFITRKRL